MNVRRLVWLVAVKIERYGPVLSTVGIVSSHSTPCRMAVVMIQTVRLRNRSPMCRPEGLGFHYYTYPALSPKRRQVTPTDARAASAPIKAAPFGTPCRTGLSSSVTQGGTGLSTRLRSRTQPNLCRLPANRRSLSASVRAGFRLRLAQSHPSTATAALVGDRGRQREPPLRMTDHKLMGQIGPLA